MIAMPQPSIVLYAVGLCCCSVCVPIGMPDAEAALEQLAAGKVLAVVHDAPILQFLVQRSYPEQLTVLPQRLDRQYYAFALPEGRPELREAIDCALLEAIEDPRWHAQLQRYLGTDE